MRTLTSLVTLALVVLANHSIWAQQASAPTDWPTSISEDMDAQIKAFVEQNDRRDGTNPMDWRYDLPEGVLVKQVTFYSNEQPVYAKIFYPADFSPEGRWPAVALGHGYNAISIAIEKYGARFAKRGLAAMVIDYRGYGFSDPWVRVLSPQDGVARERQVIRENPGRARADAARPLAAGRRHARRRLVSAGRAWCRPKPDRGSGGPATAAVSSSTWRVTTRASGRPWVRCRAPAG